MSNKLLYFLFNAMFFFLLLYFIIDLKIASIGVVCYTAGAMVGALMRGGDMEEERL